MAFDYLDLYGRSSDWAVTKVQGAATKLDAPSPCEGWSVRTLLDHMLQTQRFFLAQACGEQAELTPEPPALISDDPAGDFTEVRAEMLKAFGAPGVVDATGPMLGIAFSDLLLHGCDLARGSGQDDTMPAGLADAAYDTIHGRFTDEQRKGVFAPEVKVGDDASPQQRLLAYTGRQP
ncbi:MAG TPA: TIGR03086 family metal-binding protein [Acidimicrobiia bacterium]|jgi:uncharacterized protein (TIGR03086 family)